MGGTNRIQSGWQWHIIPYYEIEHVQDSIAQHIIRGLQTVCRRYCKSISTSIVVSTGANCSIRSLSSRMLIQVSGRIGWHHVHQQLGAHRTHFSAVGGSELKNISAIT
jgi:hypothetical protein